VCLYTRVAVRDEILKTACGGEGAQVTDREKPTLRRGKLERRANMFLNKLAACLCSRVAVQGKIFKPDWTNEMTVDFKGTKTSDGDLRRAECFGFVFAIKSALFQATTKNNIIRTNSYDVFCPVVLTRTWQTRFVS